MGPELVLGSYDETESNESGGRVRLLRDDAERAEEVWTEVVAAQSQLRREAEARPKMWRARLAMASERALRDCRPYAPIGRGRRSLSLGVPKASARHRRLEGSVSPQTDPSSL